jgi:outer membrane protein OmpA-like peptidoglycan-associated protein
MAISHTGPGRVAVNAKAPVGAVRATLGNFDIDGATLKREHLTYLQSRVVPILARKNARIWLQGSASHSGSDKHNLALSRQRARAVVDFLLAKRCREADEHRG